VKAAPWRLFGRRGVPPPSDDGLDAGTNGRFAIPDVTASGEAGTGESESQTTGDVVIARGRLHSVAVRLIAVEPWIAAACAAILLCAPNLLVWPAVVVGALPLLGRLLTTGRLWRATPFDVPLLLLVIGAALGGYASLSREGALIRLTGLLAGFLVFAALREHATGTRAHRRLVLGMLIAAVVSSALLLVLVGPFLLLEKVPPLARLVAAIDRDGWGAWFVDQDWLLQRYRFRASGVGALADIGLTLALASLVGLQRPVPRILAAVTLPFFALVLLVADNRGSMLAGALTIGLMAVVWRRRLLPLVPLGGVAAVLVVGFLVGDRGLSLKTLAQRFWFWENSLYLAREVPLTGAGLGLESVQLVYRAYFLPAYPPFSHAHNIYLQGLLEYGVFGLLGLAGLGLATLWLGWRATDAPDRWTLAGRLAGFGVALTMLTTGLTEIGLLSTLGGVLVLAGLGLLAATTPHPAAPSPASGRRGTDGGRRWTARWLAFGAGVLAVVVVLLAVSPLGSNVGARLLLNAGTVELNRGALSESLGRDERAAAIERAVTLLRQASALNPDDLTVQRNLGLALSGSDDSRRARSVMDRAKALTAPDNRGDLLQLGRAYVAVSAWGEAIRAWQAAEASPQLLQLGNRLIRVRNYDQAINAYIATARVDPQSRGAYEGVTRAAAERKATPDEQVAELEPLLQRDAPTEYGARLQAARVLREAGRLGEAGAHLVRAEDLAATPELSFENGRLMLAAGQPESAVPLLVRPAADLPYDPDNWYWLARAYAETGQHEVAITTIKQGLSKVDPSGQFAPAAPRLPETAAVRASEIKRSERALLLGVMAESLLRLDRPAEAMSLLDEALAATPKDGWLAALRDEARDARPDRLPNLLLNPSFARTGTWAIRDRVHWEYSSVETLPNEVPQIDDGRARFESTGQAGRLLVQELPSLLPGRTYRLTMSLRAEQVGTGAVAVYLTNFRTRDGAPLLVSAAEAERGVTVTVDGTVDVPPYNYLAAAVGFAPETPAGAIVWCDEATLILLEP
jgi:tetratricopeptide (TPR) repeat protein/O-antigen ligase